MDQGSNPGIDRDVWEVFLAESLRDYQHDSGSELGGLKERMTRESNQAAARKDWQRFYRAPISAQPGR